MERDRNLFQNRTFRRASGALGNALLYELVVISLLTILYTLVFGFFCLFHFTVVIFLQNGKKNIFTKFVRRLFLQKRKEEEDSHIRDSQTQNLSQKLILN